ncbi:recombinase family protein [Oceanobacillus kimchii]|uniref:recombinase family protein n=1 Tax=Oceanobacillus kimchii TaxID=746691 RepID=UPI003B01DEBD
MPRALGYVRVSTDKQLDNTSISKQKEEIKKYCEENQITLVNIYDEGAGSAENIKDRPEFKEMYSHAFKKEEIIDFVIVWHSDRISRDNLDALYVFKRLTKAKKHLVCLSNNIDTRDPKAKLLYQFMALVSELERDMIILRTSSGMEKNAKDGNFNGGQVLGYESEEKRLKIVPEEAKIVEFIFKKYAYDKWGYYKIASTLNDQGIKTKKGKDWSINAIRTILSNQLYIGKIKWKNEYRKGNHTRIIDDELWKEAQKMLKLNSYLPEKKHPGSYPLSGLLKCPKCGSAMVQSSTGKHKYYTCNKRKGGGKSACSADQISKEVVEKYVFDQFFHRLKTTNLISPLTASIISSYNSEVEPLETKLKSMQKELQNITIKKKETIEWRRQSIFNDATFKQQMQDHEKEEKQLLLYIDSVKKQLAQRNNPNLQEMIHIFVKRFEVFFNMMCDKDKKEALRLFIDKIDVKESDNIKDRTVKEISFEFKIKHLESNE